MPTKQTVASFIADVLNDHVGAIERWYTEDASIQETSRNRASDVKLWRREKDGSSRASQASEPNFSSHLS
jgi:hypothetical protein